MTKKEQIQDQGADLQIGPTDQGMVRFIISHAQGVLNLDFEPDEAREISEEILASAKRAEK